MRLIAVDDEFNQPSHKLIQIGAVCFQPDNCKVIETFMTLVNPGEPISQDPQNDIVALTRITDDRVRNAPSALMAGMMLTDFKNRLQINATPIVWGAGDSNDIKQIYTQAGLESPFTRRIIDVKGVFQVLANASNNEMRQKVGLHKACLIVGIGWDDKYGAPHDALADAWNTMRIYLFLSKCLKGGYEINKNLEFLKLPSRIMG